MPTTRLEAFSDGVLAIVITIMVLELRVPTGDDLAALRHSTGSGLLTYLISFVFIGIYWNNHHHMFQVTEQVTSATLWANLHLLFWLSLLPFTSAWVDTTGFARTPVTSYGVNLLAAGLAYVVLQRVIIRFQGPDSALRRAVGRDTKAKASLLLYVLGIGVCGVLGHVAAPGAIVVAMICFVTAPLLWLVPDRRITRVVAERPAGG
jgi:uncharacterized membrane protein